MSKGIASKKTFTALRLHGRRARSGQVRIIFLDGEEFTSPVFAFSIGRNTGNAVVRNRIRRRLKAIIRERSSELVPGAYLIGVTTHGSQLSYEELNAKVGAALSAVLKSDQE